MMVKILWKAKLLLFLIKMNTLPVLTARNNKYQWHDRGMQMQ